MLLTIPFDLTLKPKQLKEISMMDDAAHQALKKYFGYDEFRRGQDQIITRLLDGEDTVGIMPTGGGKSLCYQIPALLFSGVTLVVSPLISLMKDQVDALGNAGIQATFINSSLSFNEGKSAWQRLPAASTSWSTSLRNV
ncbi:ATP-dependent DNA helicase recQ [Sporolactobacillus inulinus]|uniref:DNA 3'-5' helicase n=1 Tax=Sporolactobacillus inulinus TaxID=2078 RepID=A0A4Y1Z6Z9_9BACL|nr:ATP-dependent DNA helicase recQ [Sporolactobacillus inulinus]